MLVSSHLKSVLKTYQHSATKSLHGPGKLPNLPSATNGSVQYPAPKCIAETNVIQQPAQAPPLRVLQIPILTAADQNYALDETQLENETISCFMVGGERRLCLPQVLQSVLRDFTLAQINHQCDSLLIYCSRCSPEQLNVLKTHLVLPSSAFSCGLITQTDAHRLCSALLHNDGKQQQQRRRRRCLSNGVGIRVKHKCFGRARGILWYAMFTSKEEKCIECVDCTCWYNPQQFVCHVCVDECRENRTVHWGFDSNEWRRYLLLDDDDADSSPTLPIANGGVEPAKRHDEEECGRFQPQHQQYAASVLDLTTGEKQKILDHMEGMYKGHLDFKSIESLKVASNFANKKYEKVEPDAHLEKTSLSSLKSDYNMSLKRKLLQHDLLQQQQQQLLADKKKAKLESNDVVLGAGQQLLPPGIRQDSGSSEPISKKMDLINAFGVHPQDSALSTIYTQFIHQSATTANISSLHQRIGKEKSAKEQQIRANIRAANMDIHNHTNNINSNSNNEHSPDRFVSKKHRFFRHLMEQKGNEENARRNEVVHLNQTSSPSQRKLDDDVVVEESQHAPRSEPNGVDVDTEVDAKIEENSLELPLPRRPSTELAAPPSTRLAADEKPSKNVEVQVKSPDSTSISLNVGGHGYDEPNALLQRVQQLVAGIEHRDEVVALFRSLLGENALLREKLAAAEKSLQRCGAPSEDVHCEEDGGESKGEIQLAKNDSERLTPTDPDPDTLKADVDEDEICTEMDGDRPSKILDAETKQ